MEIKSIINHPSPSNSEKLVDRNMRRVISGIVPYAESQLLNLLSKMSEEEAMNLCERIIDYAADMSERLPGGNDDGVAETTI
jgi:hypothetical protein